MGILDWFDSPDVLGSILGVGNLFSGGSNSAAGNVTAQNAGAPVPPAPAPSSGTPIGNAADMLPQLQASMANGTPQQASMNAVTGGGSPSAILNPDSVPLPQPAPGNPAPASGGVPLPQPAPGMPPPPAGGGIDSTPTIGPGASTGAPLNLQNPQLGVSGTALPPPPPSAMTAPPPTATTGGGLRGALGITNQNGTSPWLNFMGGLGKGLSAVGAQRPGTNAAAAFAGGAGGALQGGTNMEMQQIAALRQARLQNFNMSSTAFRDMIAAQQANNAEAFNKARSDYFESRAQQMKLGGPGTSAWQNTPYGKVISVENEAQKYEKGQQIILQKRWALNGSSPEQQQQDLDRLQTNVGAYRTRLYKQAGVNPADADKLKNMGTSPDSPFDTKGMTLEQFNSQVPMGGWYTDQNGTVRQRTVAPAGNGTPQSQVASPYDDMAAMQPAEQVNVQ